LTGPELFGDPIQPFEDGFGIKTMRRFLSALALTVAISSASFGAEEMTAACEQVVVDNIEARNTSDSDRWIGTFTEDGELVHLGSVKGRDALRQVANDWTQDVRFQLTSVEILPIDARTATGRSFVTISWPSDPSAGGRQSISEGSALLLYLDAFELTEEGCKIVRREEIDVVERRTGDAANDR